MLHFQPTGYPVFVSHWATPDQTVQPFSADKAESNLKMANTRANNQHPYFAGMKVPEPDMTVG